MLPNSLRPKRRAPWAESLKTKLCIANQRALVPGREFPRDGQSVQSLRRLARHERSSLNLALDWMLKVNICTRQDRRCDIEGGMHARWLTRHAIAASRTCAGVLLPPLLRVSGELDSDVVGAIAKCVLQ